MTEIIFHSGVPYRIAEPAPNEQEILLGLIRLAKSGDHDAADQLRRILEADLNATKDDVVAEVAGYMLAIKQAESKPVGVR